MKSKKADSFLKQLDRSKQLVAMHYTGSMVQFASYDFATKNLTQIKEPRDWSNVGGIIQTNEWKLLVTQIDQYYFEPKCDDSKSPPGKRNVTIQAFIEEHVN